MIHPFAETALADSCKKAVRICKGGRETFGMRQNCSVTNILFDVLSKNWYKCALLLCANKLKINTSETKFMILSKNK